ncbi:RidA family protein [Vagococcus zengguangii]|uniref:Reactive intermediate/imine deaminase n=1 Tax=Vagococcus zengguangii TaxID=2571750 RepID=A0A4D7CTV6_9ENTE|nr:RidA family protein [Vagococcus zengguangii]QCI86604.1 reactive intermediate/imine deaminase [Vagococcus zengguangii]TLG79760.1 reactive intermediate/imine deaminase [Vagococcus zengguangii]
MSIDNVVLARNTKEAPQNELASQSVAFSHYNNLSAVLPIDAKTDELVPGGIMEQANQCLANIKSIVESIDHVMSDVVRLSVFVKNIKDLEAIKEVYYTYFTNYQPALTMAVVADLPMGAMVQMEALLTNGEGTIPNAPQAGDLIKLTNTTQAAPIEAMSTQMVAFSHYNNVSTQLPIEPASGRIVADTIQGQALQCLKNIESILASINIPLDDIVKMTIYVKKLEDMDLVNEIYKRFFPKSAIARALGYLPARTVVEVVDLPMNAMVQMEAVVSHGDGTPPQAIEDRHGIIIEANNTKNAPICPLSTQTVAFSHYNHISAQLPIDPITNKLVENEIKVQTKQVLENIKAIIESVDHSLEDIVKVNIYLTDMTQLALVDEVYREYFSTGTPARKVVGVNHIMKGALIQMDAVAGNAEGTSPIAN